MKSRTKNRLTEQKIRELVRFSFGDTCEVSHIEEAEGGMFNAIYRMERKKEQDTIVLKAGVVPGTPLLTYEKDVMPTELACLEMVREQTRVPVPAVLAHDFSKTRLNSNYFFMTAFEGVPLSSVSKEMGKDNRNRIMEELAGCLAMLHTIKGPYYGYFTQEKAQQFATWEEAFFHMFEQLFRDAAEQKIQFPENEIRQALEQNADCLRELSEPALVNFDCHEGNVFVKKTDGEYRLEGIIDLERAFWGDPLGDFPSAFIYADDIRREEAFLQAYMRAAGKKSYTEADARRYQLYRMYILSIMAAEVFRYDFQYGKMQGEWARRGIRGCLKELL